jgi:hypothetical protein
MARFARRTGACVSQRRAAAALRARELLSNVLISEEAHTLRAANSKRPIARATRRSGPIGVLCRRRRSLSPRAVTSVVRLRRLQVPPAMATVRIGREAGGRLTIVRTPTPMVVAQSRSTRATSGGIGTTPAGSGHTAEDTLSATSRVPRRTITRDNSAGTSLVPKAKVVGLRGRTAHKARSKR